MKLSTAFTGIGTAEIAARSVVANVNSVMKSDLELACESRPGSQQVLLAEEIDHVFTNMCDALPQSGIGDIETKQRLACSSIRACDMNTMVTPNAKGVTARYHSTAGLYFYENGLV